MALSCGFYNSSNGDRKYNSVDFSRIFDGIITDGIYATYEKAMVVKASENAGEVIIQPGRAWFNHSWSYNDADYVMEAPAPEVLLDRIDALVLDVNSEMATRDNTFMWVTGTPASNPERPTLIRSVTHNQYPLCYVRRYAETTMIYAKDITNTVGTSECPFVTGVLKGINIDDMLSQWDDEFHTWENATKASFEGWMVNQQAVYTRWWDALKTQMSGDVADVEAWVQTIRGIIDSEAATHLQAEIDELNEWVPNGSYLRIVTEEQELFSRAVTISDLAGHSQTENFDANGVAIFKSFPYVGTLNIASSNGARTAVQTITVPYFTRMENVQLAFWSATVNIEADIEMAGYTVTVKDSNDATVTTVVLNANAEGIFRAQAPDTYKFQVTYGGETMEVSLAVTEETTYSVSISAGFNWRNWVTLGGLNPSSYSSLEDVFEDKAAVRRLMTIHASADYLIEGVEKKLSVIDDFVANDTAMKWIGLRDYVCDGLTAINGVEAKFLASEYWERYLKDHVPTMTANNAPYGEVIGSYLSNAFTVFDKNTSNFAVLVNDTSNANMGGHIGYKFTNPTKVNRVVITPHTDYTTLTTTLYIKASNDGSNWVELYKDTQYKADISNNDISFNNDNYYFYYKVEIASCTEQYSSSIYCAYMRELQFYGRSLNVSVPVMTSNTAPYGEASANRVYDGSTAAWKAFDGGDSTNYANGAAANLTDYLQFEFPSKMRLKMLVSKIDNNSLVEDITLRCSNDGLTFTDIDTYHYTTRTIIENVSVNEDYKIFRVQNAKALANGWFNCLTLQFYGVDYSEREFEPNTTKKWLYDHGLELEPISEAITTGGTITFGDDYVTIDRTVSANLSIATDSAIDLANYNKIFAIVDTTKNSSVALIGCARNSNVSSMSANKVITSVGSDVKDCLDISAIDTSQYPILNANNTGTFNVKELWLE